MALSKEVKDTLRKEFSLHAKDTGSVEMQVAQLTSRIKMLAQHFEKNPKDFSSKRGMLKIVAMRRKHLRYLEENNDAATYSKLTKKLGISK